MIDEKVLIERLEKRRKGVKRAMDFDGPTMALACMDGAFIQTIHDVNQLAEESKLTPCYLGSPCEYQNEDAKIPVECWNNGWIPCSKRLPENGQIAFATSWFPYVSIKSFIL